MTIRTGFLGFLALIISAEAFAAAEDARFTSAPRASRTDDRFRIDFAVRPTWRCSSRTRPARPCGTWPAACSARTRRSRSGPGPWRKASRGTARTMPASPLRAGGRRRDRQPGDQRPPRTPPSLRGQVCRPAPAAVTTRKSNLYGALLELIGQSDSSLAPKPPRHFGVACRWTRKVDAWHFEAWAHSLAVGQPLPTLPLWLAEGSAGSPQQTDPCPEKETALKNSAEPLPIHRCCPAESRTIRIHANCRKSARIPWFRTTARTNPELTLRFQ